MARSDATAVRSSRVGLAFDDSVDGQAPDAEQVAELGSAVLGGTM